MTTCQFTLVPCSKENGILYYIKKKHVKTNRGRKCKYCQEKGTYAYITQLHYCQPKKHAEIIFYRDIVKHLVAVILALVLAIILVKIDCNSDTQEYESEIMSLNRIKSDLYYRYNYNLNLIGVSSYKISTGNNSFYFSKSTSFYTKYGYYMTIQVNASSGEDIVSVYAVLLKGKFDAGLNWPFVGKVAITLLNQLRDNDHRTMILTTVTNARVGDKWGFQKFIRYSALAHDPVKNTQYLKDNTLYFRVSVEVSDHKPWLDCKI